MWYVFYPQELISCTWKCAKKRRFVCVFVVYQMSISPIFHLMGFIVVYLDVRPVLNVRHKISCKSEIYQKQKVKNSKNVEKYCGSSRSIVIQNIEKLQNISWKNISKSEKYEGNLRIWEQIQDLRYLKIEIQNRNLKKVGEKYQTNLKTKTQFFVKNVSGIPFAVLWW